MRAATGPSAPALLLAKTMPPGTDPTPYLVSEKYDGVRAVWDGRTLRFRSGRPVAAPGWFTERLPSTPLDGELWLGHGHFDELSGLVRRGVPADAGWRVLRYMLFEWPGGEGSFEQRHAALQRLAATIEPTQLSVVAQARVADAAALRRRLDEVVVPAAKGWCCIARTRPTSPAAATCC